jgi:hypothetical protein
MGGLRGRRDGPRTHHLFASFLRESRRSPIGAGQNNARLVKFGAPFEEDILVFTRS